MSISDEIDVILNGLSSFNDDIINGAIETLFADDTIMADLDASDLCILLINKKNTFEGHDSAWFNMEQL